MRRNVRNGWKADFLEPPHCAAMGRGDRSAARLSGGGAGGGRTQAEDRVCDSLRVGQDISANDAHHVQAERGHVSIPVRVMLLPSVVACTVDFDDELRRRAVEVGHERADRMLLAEAEVAAAQPQHTPEQHLGQAKLTPQPACSRHRPCSCAHGAGPSTTELRSAVPLPIAAQRGGSRQCPQCVESRHRQTGIVRAASRRG